MSDIFTSPMLDKNNHEIYYDDNKSMSFSLPFSEQDVLYLQQVFVTFGIRTIKTRNVQDGRNIVETILKSLNYYKNIGCITYENGLPSHTCDIISHVNFQKQVTKTNNDLLIDLELFFTNHAHFDFIWIELTKELQEKYTTEKIKNVFDMYHVEERMPVIIVKYDE